MTNTTREGIELLPCRKCKSSNIEFLGNGHSLGWYGWCANCHNQGNVYGTKEYAAEAWNKQQTAQTKDERIAELEAAYQAAKTDELAFLENTIDEFSGGVDLVRRLENRLDELKGESRG